MTTSLNVLLVEDDPGDILMAREALADQPVLRELHVARDGVEAMTFLRGPHQADSPTDLVLLDLNLPGMDGREVLAEIRGDERLTHLPVVVLSTSSSVEDVEATYRLHANAFVTKPSGFDAYAAAVREIGRFFHEVARLPRPSAS